MSNVEFTIEWVHNTLDQIAKAFTMCLHTKDKTDGDKYLNKIETTINSWTIAFEQKHTWNLEEFLIVCIGDFIFHELLKQRFEIPNNIADCERGVMIVRSKNTQDITNLKRQFDEILKEKYHQLKNLLQQESIQKETTAFHWLDKIIEVSKSNKIDLSIQRFIEKCAVHKGNSNEIDTCVSWLAPADKIELIPKHFSEHILYVYHDLEPEKAKYGLPSPNLLTVDEVCLALNINKPNLFKLCMNTNIGVYIRKQTFLMETHWMGNDIRYISDFIDLAYPYPYKGLVRLRRDKKIRQGKGDVSAFYEGNEISLNTLYDKPANHKEWILHLQPSISEVIQDKLLYFHMLPQQKITLNDLWFIEDEISKYKKKKQQNKVHKKNGKLSGESRTVKAKKIWDEIKPPILILAKSLSPTSPNHIAQIAVNRKLTNYDISTIRRKIQKDKDFLPHLKKK